MFGNLFRGGGGGAPCQPQQQEEVIIVWDIENCPVPPSLTVYDVLECLEREFVRNHPSRLLTSWCVSISEGSRRYLDIGRSVLEELNNRGVFVFYNSGEGKLGDTDVPLRTAIQKFVDTWLRRKKSYPAVVVMVGSDADFHHDLRRAADEGITCYRVFSRSNVARSVATMPGIHNEEFIALLQRYFGPQQGKDDTHLLGAGVATNQAQQQQLPKPLSTSPPPPPRPAAAGLPQPTLTQQASLKAYINFVPPDGNVTWTRGVVGPLKDATALDIQDWLRPTFDVRPGFVSMKAGFYTNDKHKNARTAYLWVNFSSLANAKAAHAALGKVRKVFRSPLNGGTATYELAMPQEPQAAATSAAPLKQDAELKVEEVVFKVAHHAPAGTLLPEGFLAQNARDLIVKHLAPRLKKLAEDTGVTILPPVSDGGAAAALNDDAIGFDNNRLRVKGSALNVDAFEARLHSLCLDGILHTVVPFKPDSLFQLPGGQALVGDKLDAARVFIAARLRKLRKRLDFIMGDNGFTSTPTPMYGGKNDVQPPGQPYMLVVTCAAADVMTSIEAPPGTLSRLDIAMRELEAASKGPWALTSVASVFVKSAGGALDSLLKGIRGLNEGQMGVSGDCRYRITHHKDDKKYLVWGQGKSDVDEGSAELQDLLANLVGVPSVRRVKCVAPSAVLFNLVKRSDAFKDLAKEAQLKNDVHIAAGPTNDKGPYLPGRTFTLRGTAGVDKYVQRLVRMLENQQKKVTRLELQVPDEARCLFLPGNIQEINELLQELAESKDHPVWMSRPDDGFIIKGLLYEKDQGVVAASDDIDGSDDDSASMKTSSSSHSGGRSDGTAKPASGGPSPAAAGNTSSPAGGSGRGSTAGSTTGGVGTTAAAVTATASSDTTNAVGFKLAVIDMPGANGVKHSVTLLVGDITAARTELLINTANGQMAHRGGVAAAIIRAAGEDVDEESRKLRDKLYGGCVPVGMSISTPAGKLELQGVRRILHAVSPTFSPLAAAKGQLASCVTEVLAALEEHRLQSATMPLLGAGIYAWPVADSCNTILDTLKKGLEHHTVSISICIVENDHKKASEAAQCFVAAGGKAIVQPPTAAALAASTAAQSAAQWEYFVPITDAAYIYTKELGIRDLPVHEVGGVKGVWNPMRLSAGKQLEADFGKWVTSGKDAALQESVLQADNWKYNDVTYTVNFNTMQQVNSSTKFMRLVRRALPPGAAADATQQAQQATSPPPPSLRPAPPAAVQPPNVRPVTAPVAAAATKAAARLARQAARDAKAAVELFEYRERVLKGPLVFTFEGITSDVQKAVKRLKSEFASRCRVEQKDTPEGMRYLRKVLRGQMLSEASKRGLQLRLERKPAAGAGAGVSAGSSSSTMTPAWSMTCAGAKDDVDGFLRHVWDVLIARELARQAAEAAVATVYPDTWAALAAAAAIADFAGADDFDDDDSDSSGLPSFLLVDLLKPVPTSNGSAASAPAAVAAAGAAAAAGAGAAAASSSGSSSSLQDRCVDPNVGAEVAFVAGLWGCTMDEELIVQITRVQNTMQYDQFDQQREIFLQAGLKPHLPYKSGLQHEPQFNKSANKWLWHGTRSTPPAKVIESPFFLEQGFSDPRCFWGAANYFAENASYCAKGYQHNLPDGNRQVLMCEVLTGYSKDYDAETQPLLRMPPAIEPTDPLFAAVATASDQRYSSVSGVTAGSRVFMTYTQGAVRQYPHYVVTYKPPGITGRAQVV